ncbi:MAG: hypothetical protein A2X42_04225 [Candidatus Margulisbacteria bacterium GWF2_38_17]|nr:MAG: hypothetical protein A2X42_04225 [Candidatus Margulisbacteria bacterium GWF2_38_17]
MERYTVNGSQKLENRIKSHMDLIKNNILQEFDENTIQAIIMIGGYGRGEGTVRIDNGEENVFNDYDFFIISKALGPITTTRMKKKLVHLSGKLTKLVGIEVDLSLLTMKAFSRLPFTLMNYDMRQKSRIIHGNQSILDHLPPYNDAQMPAIEGTRLLLNRGALLIYCKQQLADHATLELSEREIIIKYINKAILAMGDSFLIINKKYHYSYKVKEETISHIDNPGFPLFEELKKAYLAAIEFKFTVNFDIHKTTDVLDWLKKTINIYESYVLWYESKRLQTPIPSWDSYKKLILLSSTMVPFHVKIKSLLINMREFGIKKTLQDIDICTCYPRDRLYIVYPFILFKKEQAMFTNSNYISKIAIADTKSLTNTFWNIWIKYS